MAPSLRWWIAGVIFGASLLSMCAFGEADGSTDSWRAVLPKEVYRELTDREIRLVRELLKDIPDKRSLDRARFGAVLIAALSMSVKEGLLPRMCVTNVRWRSGLPVHSETKNN